MDNEVLAIIQVTEVRRIVGAAVLAGAGGGLVYVALGSVQAPVWQITLALMGFGALWLAFRVWTARNLRIELTERGLADSDGVTIAPIEDIATLDRGFFAMKPSNGFVLCMKTPGTRAWRPGVWWRLGRRIGIGGITPPSQAKIMADILALKLSERD